MQDVIKDKEQTDSQGYPIDKNKIRIDFPNMSDSQRKALTGEKKYYYEFNSQISNLQFSGQFEANQTKTDLEVLGDGTTRINVYYNRKKFNLKFFYAKTQGGRVTTASDGSNQWIKESGSVFLSSGTKVFSGNSQDGNNTASDNLINQLKGSDVFCKSVVSNLPTITKEGLKSYCINDPDDTSNNYWYYKREGYYGSSMENIWFNDAFNTLTRNKTPVGENVCFGSWAVSKGSQYKIGRSNYTVKGYFEKLDGDVLYSEKFINYNKSDDSDNFKSSDLKLTDLIFVASWTNTSTQSNNYNYGYDRVYNFTYKNYTELLPYEKYIYYNCPDGENILKNGGTYPAGDYNGNHYLSRQYKGPDGNNKFYKDIILNNGVVYGLKQENEIETFDSGTQYSDNLSSFNDSLPYAVYKNQTPVSLIGFTLAENDDITPIDSNSGDYNPQSFWYAKGSFDDTHHADVCFFYRRNVFELEYRNKNNPEYASERNAEYNAPLFLDKFQYTPLYPDPELRPHYTFAGWYYTPYYYKQVDFNTARMPNDDLTLYAKWIPKIINVSFYPTYNDYYEGKNRIGNEIPVEYGKYTPLENIPINATSNERPRLNPPAQGAQFAGWYYLRDNVPVRFEPENLPVTALNYEASVHNGHLKLFAEWVTKDVAKYQVKYVEKDHPEREVATETTGRAFVFKTKTFNAKGGDQLNADHAWEEDGTNWWPTTNSTSILIRANAQGEEFEPNTCKFEYVQKQKVHYKIQYLDAASRTPLLDEVTRESGHASIEEDAPFIPGYAITEGTKTLVLTASTAETEEEQEAEELATNVITFYYNKNSTEYIYEVEYYTQNTGDDDYTMAQKENLAVTIASQGDTTVSIANIYNRHIPSVFEQNGFTRKANATTVTETNGSVNTYGIADDANVVISPAHRTTIKVYYDRNTYYYSYKYVDHTQEKLYNDKLKNNESVDGVWDGVIQEFPNQGPARVETDVTIRGERDITYHGTPYTRINTRDLTLNIAPSTPANPHVNEVKIYYKKFTERELQFKLSCKNENSPYTDVDYDHNTGDPLYGGISLPMQTIDSYSDIQSVEFYDFNEAKTSNGGVEYYIHNHKYNFLGWYDNPEGTGTPLTTNAILSKENLGLNESLPARDKTYYAVVEQVLVRANFEFRLVDETLPIGTGDGETEEDRQAAAIVAAAESDPNGDYTGSYFDFSAPSTYVNNTPVPWHRTDGYSMSIMPKDNRVYKYEFAEWWEEDLTVTPHKLIRKKNWNSSGEWSPTILQNQVTRNGDISISIISCLSVYMSSLESFIYVQGLLILALLVLRASLSLGI